MPTSRSKTTKAAAAAAEKKPAVKKAAPKARAAAKPKASKGPSTEERIARLEEKLSLLITVLHHNFSKDLVKGPKDLASKIRKNGLLE
tara:strand:+ start:459 stop:722 length:264 start_codon:yes stop_codon:yes gene_type:complete